MQSVNPVLPAREFVPEHLCSPDEAVAAFFGRVKIAPPQLESVGLDDALGRALGQPIAADADYPSAPRSVMDGFAVISDATPGRFEILGDVRMGSGAALPITDVSTMRIPTGGVLPPGATAVVPNEEARVENTFVIIEQAIENGANVAEAAADMRRGESLLAAGRRLRASDIGLLATLGDRKSVV